MSATNTPTPPRPLFQFAYFRQWSANIADLAAAAETEDWTGNNPTQNAILANYVHYMYERLCLEDKIRYSDGDKWAAFNTGLLNPIGHEIFGLFQANHNQDKQNWFFKNWMDESNVSFMNNFAASLPEMADFVNPPVDLVYDWTKSLTVCTHHIMSENILRFPQHLQTDQVRARQALDSAINMAKKRLRRNYKVAVPQWFPSSNVRPVQLLLPLDLDQRGTADLALVVSKVGGVYRGNTVLTLDMAYSNARLVARPDSEWLKP